MTNSRARSAHWPRPFRARRLVEKGLTLPLRTGFSATAMRLPFLLSFALALSGVPLRAADDAAKSGARFFEEKIRPILADNCFKCHSHEAKKVKGGLMLDSREAALTGGDTAPAVVPGDPGKSLLIEAVSYANEDLQM